MKTAALLVIAPLLLPCAARACLQDRDSLETEARGVPDVIRALSGRFERNPPLFYQMRIRRVERELKSNPSRLDLYDDIAVAHDRLHQDKLACKYLTPRFRACASTGIATGPTSELSARTTGFKMAPTAPS